MVVCAVTKSYMYIYVYIYIYIYILATLRCVKGAPRMFTQFGFFRYLRVGVQLCRHLYWSRRFSVTSFASVLAYFIWDSRGFPVMPRFWDLLYMESINASCVFVICNCCIYIGPQWFLEGLVRDRSCDTHCFGWCFALVCFPGTIPGYHVF